MSEEVLKALMQLFAIIANQDGGSDNTHYEYVKIFLKSQISEDRIHEFLDYYSSFIKVNTEEAGASRTSMKDSVRTLGICRKINKTLNQKQKIIVFARLWEFTVQDPKESSSRTELLNTVADVFNITKEETRAVNLILNENYAEYNADFLLVQDQILATSDCKQILIPGFAGVCIFYYIRESNLIFFLYRGQNEINLNGLIVKPYRIHVLSPGSTIRHSKGTIFYSDIINRFLGESFENRVQFNCAIQEHRHPNGKTALRDFHFNEKSGSLVGIMGASGSGKTTLLNVLSGNDLVSDGKISINGADINDRKTNITGVIGFIPQDDLLIEELTVFQNLSLSTKLCFKNITEQELNDKVLNVLKQLGLLEVKDIRVGNPLNKKISGGQRKRLNIALELIREPQILFVDEPTSGLSSRDSENVMDLLKELSQKGKLIFVVIHQPSSDIYKLFDRIFLLDTGGYPIYYGNPVEALVYFKKETNQINSHVAECHTCGSVNPELIFNLIEAKELDEYGNYTDKRKINPEGWFSLYKKNFPKLGTLAGEVFEKIKQTAIPGKFKQLTVFLTRDLLAKISNKQYLLINLLEVPALALLLSVLIRFANFSGGDLAYSYYKNENIPAFFFMAIIVALLVGLTVSAEEIFKDQKILKREKFLHLSRLSYLISKVIILFTLSAIQALMLCLIGVLVLKVPAPFLPFYLTIFSVFCAANLMGLVLSSTFNSPVTIYIVIPLVIIPQMMLGGAMFKYSKLNEWLNNGNNKVPAVSNFMVSRWAYEGIIVSSFQENTYEKEMFILDKVESKLNYRVSYLVPKLEELNDILIKGDSLIPEKRRKMLKGIISNTLKTEFAKSKEMYGKVDVAEEEDSLETLKMFYADKYNLVLDKKTKAEDKLEAKGILKNQFANKNLEELVTNALEKNKIQVDSSKQEFIQLIDPIFKDPTPSSTLGLDAHFYAPAKYLSGKQLATNTYNLVMIWILNIFTFLLLYFDVLRKAANFLTRIKKHKTT
jgi:ABC transport system ATP-binding/permease protein